GHFSIDGLAEGKYLIYYSKPEDDYPRTDFSFYTGGRTLPVYVTQSNPAPKISIVLGPKGGRLVGRIVDVSTNTPVAGARFLLRRSDRPAYWVSEGVSPTFNLLIPSDVGFTLTVDAEGYETLPYGAAPGSSLPKVLRVDPERSLSLSIKLRSRKGN